MRPHLASLAVLSLLSLGASAQPPVDDPLVVISAHYDSRAQLQTIAAHFQHLLIDKKRHTIRAEATHDDMMALRRQGIDAQIDDAATQQLRRSELQMHQAMQQGAEVDAITGFPCYRTVDETYATMDQLVSARPTLAHIVDIGPTWLESQQAGAGHRMRVLQLTNAATNALYPHKPRMVVFASIHAREYAPAELLTRFAESLVNGYGIDDEATWLLDNFRFDLVLQANPDGREKAEAGLSWRKNVDDTNGACSDTTYGIDLNRNFPYLWGTVADGSSTDPCTSTYRGPSRTSEVEARNLLRYVAGTPNASGVYSGGALPNQTLSTAPMPHRNGTIPSPSQQIVSGLFVDLHSYGQLMMWPWAYTTTPAKDAVAMRTLGRRMAYFDGYTPEQWSGMYLADGSTGDTYYGLLGVPSYTIEMGTEFFESCSNFESNILTQNLASLRYAARNLAAPLLLPTGPDATSVSVSSKSVTRGTPVVVTATVDDSRFNQSNGTETVQNVIAARAFLDSQPWRPSRNVYAMHANDGSFNSATETVSVTIPTGAMALGRHVVAISGTDASQHAGTPNAVYFTVK